MRGNVLFKRAHGRAFMKAHAGLKQRVLLPLITGVAYYFGALLGVAVSSSSDGVALFWLPNGIVLAVLLMVERRAWPWHLAAAILAEVAADFPVFTLAQSLIFAGANILECVIAALLLQRVARPFTLDRLHRLSMFGAYALVVACGLASLIGSVAYRATLAVPPPFLDFWSIWWIGDGMGMLLVVPLLLGWLQGARPPVPAGRAEAAAVLALTLVLTLAVFLEDVNAGEASRRPFLLMPLSLWVAVRLGVRGAATVGLLIAAVAVAATLGGHGPLLDATPRGTVLLLQQYLAVQLLSMLAVAALLQELRERNDQLRLRERALEAISDGVVVVDARVPELPVAFSNPAYTTAAPNTSADALLRACRSGDPGDPELGALCAALREGRAARHTLQLGATDGAIWNDLLVAPVRDANGRVTHYVAVQHDMTEIKRNEMELRATHEALDRLNRELEARVETRTRELQDANLRLEELASTDPLTGASNRRHFLDQARKEISRAKRQGVALSVIMLDIDLFKQINDRYGHDAGDQALVELARAIRSALRAADVFARLGGEEFIVMLPGHGLEEAVQMAERLRALVEAIRNPAVPEGLTISLGATALQGEAEDINDLLRRADHALYAAKHQGRNRVCASEPTSPH